MDNGAVAAAEGVGELLAVEQVCNCLTDSSKLRRAKVALEHQLAVAVTGVMAVDEAAGVSQVERGIDLVAFAELGKGR